MARLVVLAGVDTARPQRTESCAEAIGRALGDLLRQSAAHSEKHTVAAHAADYPDIQPQLWRP